MSVTAVRKKSARYGREPKLWQHPSGRWCCKRRVNGVARWYYFGASKVDGDVAFSVWKKLVWTEGLDPDEAYQTAIRTIRPNDESDDEPATGKLAPTVVTVEYLCEHFLHSKRQKLGTGEISGRTIDFYKRSANKIIKLFGKTRDVSTLTPDDFIRLRISLGRGTSPYTLRNDVRTARMIFTHAMKVRDAAGQRVLERPVDIGDDEFNAPSKTRLRKHKQQQQRTRGARMFDAAELRRIIGAAPLVLKAMIMLGANAAFGATDIAELPMSAIDLDHGWVTFPRPKTAVERRAKLWAETVEALRAAVPVRPAPRFSEDADRVFLTTKGQKWVREHAGGGPIDSVGLEFSKLLTKLNLKRNGLSFYALRHTCRTIMDDAGDQRAADCVMGHAVQAMSEEYRQRIVPDERLELVSEFVRQWLFEEAKGGAVPAAVRVDGEPALRVVG